MAKIRAKQIRKAMPTYIDKTENVPEINKDGNSTTEDKTNKNKKILLVALEKSLGVVTTACRAVGMSRTQHYEWIKEDPEYKQAVEDLADVAIDFAESKLHKLIDQGDTASTIFYLKTKGKKRGYIERVENMFGEVEQPLFGPEDSEQD